MQHAPGLTSDLEVADSHDEDPGKWVIMYVLMVVTFVYVVLSRRWALRRGPRVVEPQELIPCTLGGAVTLEDLDVKIVPYAPDEQEEERMCQVCLEEFEPGDATVVLSCAHVYHKSCIRDWVHIRATCPACRCPQVLRKKEAESASPGSQDRVFAAEPQMSVTVVETVERMVGTSAEPMASFPTTTPTANPRWTWSPFSTR